MSAPDPKAPPARAPSITLRSLTADDLIQLPRFDPSSAIALGERLLVAASAEPNLPKPIARARDVLELSLGDLRAALEARVAARKATATTTDEELANAADSALDGCWSALYEWLSGYAKLPPRFSERDDAQTLLDELYPDGLGFILLPYDVEWAESDRRLRRLTTEPIGDLLSGLGGTVFIDALHAAHAQYGEILGLPAKSGPLHGGVPSTRTALDRFSSTLRVYALKVTAQIELDDAESAVLAKRLLEPLFGAPKTGDKRPSVVTHDKRP